MMRCVLGHGLPTVEAIREAWQTRQKKVHSLNCSWRSAEFMTAKQARSFSGGSELPNEDLMTESYSHFIIDQSRNIRFDNRTKVWSSEKGEYIDHHTELAYLQGSQTLLYRKSNLFPTANIQSETVDEVIKNIRLMPFKMAFFTADSQLGRSVLLNRTDFDVTDLVDIDGRECAVLELPQTPDQVPRSTLYVDVNRDFLPLRWELFGVMDRLVQMVEITEYEKHSAQLWMPKNWKTVWKFDEEGKPTWSFTSFLESYEMNKPIDVSLFKLEIPDGTFVTNHDTEVSFIKKPGNKERLILPGEFDGTNYQELLNTETGKARAGLIKEDNSVAWRTWLVLLNVVFLVGLFIFIFRKRLQGV